MSDFVGKLLTGLASLMDKYIPGKGARTFTTITLAVLAQVTLYLTHQETKEIASTNILGLVSVVFAALHQSPPTPPVTPS